GSRTCGASDRVGTAPPRPGRAPARMQPGPFCLLGVLGVESPGPVAVTRPEGARERIECTAFDRRAGRGHECLVKRDVVQGQHSVGEDLPRLMKMPQIGPAELEARFAR